MKKYNVTVNGTAYQVEVEEAGGGHAALQALPVQHPTSAPAQFTPHQPPPQAVVQPTAPVAAPAAPAAKSAPAAKAAPSGDVVTVDSPMPGKIISVSVTPGQTIEDGEPLLILEAMKMENEIYSPTDGVIESVRVSKGDSVNSGDILITIKS
ncbi:MAG: biotin/lipoyl-binding protein [Clostridiales Family XIII bacterium]|jgi:glutaconyl-CoA decarboxylase|nr:biotin/lipoyl-binding protein [Clostridiales Family XIII bacterium]